MDINNLKGLMEAYHQVYAPEQLDEMGQPKDKAAYDAQVSKNRAALGNTLLYGNSKGRTPSKPTAKQQMRQKIQANRPSATKPAAAPAAKPATPAPTPAAKPTAATPTPTPKPATPAAKPSAAKVAPAAKPEKPAPGTKAAGPGSIKPKTPNPLMQKTFGYQKGQAPDQIKSATDTAAKNLSGTGALKKEELDIFDVVLEFLQAKGFAKTLEEAEWLMANKLDAEDIANILESMHGDEEDKKEMKKGKKSKEEDIDDEDDDEDEEDLDEALTGERYKKVMKKPGGMAYSRMVSANPSKRATRGGRGGESDFGAGDRGSGNKSRRRRGLPVGDED